MIKRIIIICEGETEKEFCTTILAKHFSDKNIHIQAPLIKKSMGGIVKWTHLKKQIQNHLIADRSAFVTTLIDYYGLNKKLGFPMWEESKKELDKVSRMDILETGMLESIDESLQFRFLPYIQLHEFEGLLFNNMKIFYELFSENELIGKEELDKVFKEFDNPELINDSPDASPSHRLEKIIYGYDKIIYGNILAEAIGLANIRKKSPRFNNWIKKLEEI